MAHYQNLYVAQCWALYDLFQTGTTENFQQLPADLLAG